METSIKLWVEKIQGKPLPSLSLIRDFDYLRTLLHRLEPSFFQASSTSTYDGLLDQITEYYRKHQRLDISSALRVASKQQDILKLWGIVLGIAIRCSERNENIQLILSLDEKIQSSLMGFISKIDETLEACASLEMESSKRENANLERHLLDTIDEISEENTLLKTKIEELEDQFHNYRNNKEETTLTLETQLSQLHAERLEVLNEYEAVYNTDNLFVVFKAIENQNVVLKDTLEKKEGIIEDLEKQVRRLKGTVERMAEENKVMKINMTNLEALQAQIEEQQEEIQSLRKNENQHLERIFDMQRGYSPTKLERRDRERPQTMQPIEEEPEEENPSRSFQSSKPAIVNPSSDQKLVRSINHKRSSISVQLKPYEREKEHLEKIKLLEDKAQQMTGRLDKTNEELLVRSEEAKYQGDRYKELEEKVKHVQTINEIYSKNLKDKDKTLVQKDEEYEARFEDLVCEISALRGATEQGSANLEQLRTESSESMGATKTEYQLKINNIMAMLQDELVNFRNKQLEYLEAIRQLKMVRRSDLAMSNYDLNKSTFKMERLEDEVKEEGEGEQMKEGEYVKRQSYLKRDSRMSRVSNEEGRLTGRVRELEEELASVEVVKEEMSRKLEASQMREKMSMEEIGKLLEEIIKLKEEVTSTKDKFRRYLQEEIIRLKSADRSNNPNPQDTQEKLKVLEQLQSEIEGLRSLRERSQQDIQLHRDQLLEFLRGELKQTNNSPQSLESPADTLSTEPGVWPPMDKEKYSRNQHLEQELSKRSQQNTTLRQSNTQLELEILNLKQTIASSEALRQTIQSKVTQLESQLLTTGSSSMEYYREVSTLLDEIHRHKLHSSDKDNIIESLQNTIKDNSTHQLESQTNGAGGQYGRALHLANGKLKSELERQAHSFCLFRRRYVEMHNRHRLLEEEHALLVGVFSELASVH